MMKKSDQSMSKKDVLKKGGKLLIGAYLMMVFSACAPLESLDNNTQYQQAKQVVSSGANYVGDKTVHLINSNKVTQKRGDKVETLTQKVVSGAQAETDKLVEKGKEKFNKKYNSIKESIKQQIKSGINEKIDESFANL